MLTNKKGQISIEILIVLGVLILGSILVSTYYLQSLNKKNSQAAEAESIIDSLYVDLDSETQINPVTECNNGPLHCCNNLFDSDLDEEGIDCGGPCGASCESEESFSIDLTLVPPNQTEENTDFNIIVYANNQTQYNDPVINSVYVFDSSGLPSSNCILLNSNITDLKRSGSYTNLFLPFDGDFKTLTFNCVLNTTASQIYNITVLASIESEPFYNDFKSINKTIYSGENPPPIYESFGIGLELYPLGPTPEGSDFAIIVSTDNNTSYKDPMIKTVKITDETQIYTSNCFLKGTDYTVPNHIYSDLDILLEDKQKLLLFFNCSLTNPSEPENLLISVSAEIDSNNYFTDEKTIGKTISPQTISGCLEYTGNLVFSTLPGTYNNDKTLTLAYVDDSYCEGELHYTLDGSEPTISSPKFIGNPLNLTGNITDVNKTVVKAKVFGKNDLDQDISTSTYSRTYIFKVANPVANPWPLPGGANFASPIYVSLSDDTIGSTIKYNTGGAFYLPYDAPINLVSTTDLVIYANKPNYLPSDTTTLNYNFAESTINRCPPVPISCELEGDGSKYNPLLIPDAQALYCVREHQIKQFRYYTYLRAIADSTLIQNLVPESDYSLPDGWTLVFDNDTQQPIGLIDSVGDEYLYSPDQFNAGLPLPYCYYQLTNDINLSPKKLNEYEWYDELSGFPTIGGPSFVTSNPGGHSYNCADFVTQNGGYEIAGPQTKLVFRGSFEGRGHTLSDIYMDNRGFRQHHVSDEIAYDITTCQEDTESTLYITPMLYSDFHENGLFGSLEQDSKIEKLNLLNPTFFSAFSRTGILAASIVSNSEITSIDVKNGFLYLDAVDGDFDNSYWHQDYINVVGGLVGENSGLISNVSFSGKIETDGGLVSGLGGLVGWNTGLGVVNDAHFRGDIISWVGDAKYPQESIGSLDYSYYLAINSTENHGGLLGSSQGVLSNSSFVGNITATSERFGGLVGYLNNGHISKSFVDANIYTGTSAAGGGLVGDLQCNVLGPNGAHVCASIIDSYGVVNFYNGSETPASVDIGGLSRSIKNRPRDYLDPYFSNPLLKNTYTITNQIEFYNPEAPETFSCGVTEKQNNISVRSVYFNIDTCSYFMPSYLFNTTNYGILPLDSSEMKEVSNFGGWDFTNIWNIDPSGIINNGGPYLRNNLPPEN